MSIHTRQFDHSTFASWRQRTLLRLFMAILIQVLIETLPFCLPLFPPHAHTLTHTHHSPLRTFQSLSEWESDDSVAWEYGYPYAKYPDTPEFHIGYVPAGTYHTHQSCTHIPPPPPTLTNYIHKSNRAQGCMGRDVQSISGSSSRGTS